VLPTSPPATVIDRLCKLIEALIALCLAAMVVMVFGNVVLRYVFNSGISVSEELSRWLFVWLTFLGAIVALKEHGHLGSDMLVSRLPVWGKKLCLVAGQLLMLYITWLIFSGGLAQVRINWDVEAPVTGLPMATVYAAAVVFAVAAAGLLLRDTLRAVSGRLSESELVMVKESEEAAELQALQARLAEAERGGPTGQATDRQGSKLP
jgi:TRAP-type C4-dicarboxylate transport system permease small subunit